MLFAGFNVYQGHLSLFGIIVFGVLGDMIGASIAYGIGYWGRKSWSSATATSCTSRSGGSTAPTVVRALGAPVIVVSRWIPFARAAFPYAAGVARMGYLRFLAFATLGSIVWIAALGVLGNAVGSNWESWRHNLEYVDYVGAALLVAAIAYLIVRLARTTGRRPDRRRALSVAAPSAASEELPIWQAVALGALHGPAELLPISSSGHIAVIPWLAGWNYSRLDDELRKSFEVALHTGTAAALLISLRREVDDAVRGLNPRRIGRSGCRSRRRRDRLPVRAVDRAPFRDASDRRRRPVRGRGGDGAGRPGAPGAPAEDAGAVDALWLGVGAGVLAVPGVSRNGATLAAARWRRFTRVDANACRAMRRCRSSPARRC